MDGLVYYWYPSVVSPFATSTNSEDTGREIIIRKWLPEGAMAELATLLPYFTGFSPDLVRV